VRVGASITSALRFEEGPVSLPASIIGPSISGGDWAVCSLLGDAKGVVSGCASIDVDNLITGVSRKNPTGKIGVGTTSVSSNIEVTAGLDGP
jgi:hypothetical protein